LHSPPQIRNLLVLLEHGQSLLARQWFLLNCGALVAAVAVALKIQPMGVVAVAVAAHTHNLSCLLHH
jgi:Flp pilus assembly protein TadB